ncbi:arsenic resistance protein [Luethyella okanaganae]|uniref:Arsenic resistance protein n=1 Tax=Luethyella okanaganae TaxID=69372 RepID=A0ABW1VD11_9MICO
MLRTPDQPAPARIRRVLSWQGGGPFATTALFLAAILLGSVVGAISPAIGGIASYGVDGTVLLLVTLLFFEVRFTTLPQILQAPRFLIVAWFANFVVIPLIGFGIASLFLSGMPLLFVGAMIYFVSPCTDWFLGFTRLANGNTTLGAVLLPINMLSQLLLFPVFLWLFARTRIEIDPVVIGQTLLQWFVVPLLIAVIGRAVLSRVLPAAVFDRLLLVVARLTPLVIAALIVLIFAVNVGTILNNAGAFAIILVAASAFFVLSYLLGEGTTRMFHFGYQEHALLTMTTAARNAPLMLAVTTVALPGQPLVSAAIVIGMLVEFPHLTVVTQLLLRRRERIRPASKLRQARRKRVASLAEPRP